MLVDDALNESMLNPSLIKDMSTSENDDKNTEIHQEKDNSDEKKNDESDGNDDSEK